MKIEGILIFETDDRYQDTADIERSVSRTIDACLLKEGVNAHMLTWSVRKSEVAELRKKQQAIVEQFPGICGNCTKFQGVCRRPGVIECPDYKAV